MNFFMSGRVCAYVVRGCRGGEASGLHRGVEADGRAGDTLGEKSFDWIAMGPREC